MKLIVTWLSLVSSTPLYDFSSGCPSGPIVIGANVTRIPREAFSRCSRRFSVTFESPASLTSIGIRAFERSGLTAITLPSNLTSIGEWAFYLCNRLTSIDIPDSVTTLGAQAFLNAGSLTDVSLSDSLAVLEYGVFSGCTELTDISLPNSINSIKSRAFNGCSKLRTVSLPANLTTIESSAFRSCFRLEGFVQPESGNVTSVMPTTLRTVAIYAFSTCDSLGSLVVPYGCAVHHWAGKSFSFAHCPSTSHLEIPEGVTRILDGYYAECRSPRIESISFPVSSAQRPPRTLSLRTVMPWALQRRGAFAR